MPGAEGQGAGGGEDKERGQEKKLGFLSKCHVKPSGGFRQGRLTFKRSLRCHVEKIVGCEPGRRVWAGDHCRRRGERECVSGNGDSGWKW